MIVTLSEPDQGELFCYIKRKTLYRFSRTDARAFGDDYYRSSIPISPGSEISSHETLHGSIEKMTRPRASGLGGLQLRYPKPDRGRFDVERRRRISTSGGRFRPVDHRYDRRRTSSFRTGTERNRGRTRRVTPDWNVVSRDTYGHCESGLRGANPPRSRRHDARFGRGRPTEGRSPSRPEKTTSPSTVGAPYELADHATVRQLRTGAR